MPKEGGSRQFNKRESLKQQALLFAVFNRASAPEGFCSPGCRRSQIRLPSGRVQVLHVKLSEESTSGRSMEAVDLSAIPCSRRRCNALADLYR